MLTILAIILGFVVVTAAMRATDRVLAGRVMTTTLAARSSYTLD